MVVGPAVDTLLKPDSVGEMVGPGTVESKSTAKSDAEADTALEHIKHIASAQARLRLLMELNFLLNEDRAIDGCES